MAVPSANRKGGPLLLIVCILIICGLCYGLKLAFSQPVTELMDTMTVSNGPDTIFELKDGSAMPGEGKLQINDEQIEYIRVDENGNAIKKGAILRKNPNRFKIVSRGANGTKVEDHPKGAKVRPVATLFFPENNATYGEDVDALFYLILWITGIAFVLTEAFFLYCVFAFWGKKNDPERASYSHGNHKLELVWTIVPALILLILAIAQSSMWTEMKMEIPKNGEDDALTVQVAARQFNWFFRYAGNDGEFGTPDDISAKELTVPTGRKVRLEMRTMDVLHSFFLPNYRFKQDLVPGMAIPGWFQAIKPGRFPVMCAELCGNNHTTMGTGMVVMEPEKFDAWYKERSEFWAGENDGAERPEWWGDTGPWWWWWDRNPTQVGFQGNLGL